MNQYANGWYPEEVAELIRLNGDGFSAKEMGKALGRSPKSINCKRWKLGLKVPAVLRKRVERTPRRAREDQSLIVDIQAAPKAPVIDFPIRGLTIAHPEFSGCRWPVGGNGEDTRFCCRPKTRGSYCGRHAKRAYTGKATPASELARALRRYA